MYGGEGTIDFFQKKPSMMGREGWVGLETVTDGDGGWEMEDGEW